MPSSDPRSPSEPPTASACRSPAAHGAASRWVAIYGDPIWRFARSRTGSDDAAEEIVQETFLAALGSFDRFEGQSSEQTWIFGIAAHKIADHLRRQRRQERHHSPEHLDESADSEASVGPAGFTPSGTWSQQPGPWGNDPAEAAELLLALAQCLQELPPSVAEAIWLRDLLEMPSDEVCKALGLSATNLWTRTHRGRSALRACIEQRLFPRKDSTS